MSSVTDTAVVYRFMEILQEMKKPPQMFKFQINFIILYHYVHNNILR